MKVKILHKFHDKVDFMKVYLVGETVTFDDTRAEALIKRGLVESAEETKEVSLESEEEIAEAPEEADVESVVEEAEEADAEAEGVIEEAEETQAEPEPAETEEITDEAPIEEAVEEPQPEVRVKPVATKRKK